METAEWQQTSPCEWIIHQDYTPAY